MHNCRDLYSKGLLMNIKAYLLAIMLAFSVTACSSSAIISAISGAMGIGGGKPAIAIDTEIGDDTATIGDSQSIQVDDVNGNLTTNTTKNEKTVTQADNVTYNEFTPLTMSIVGFLVVLSVIGWAAPQISFRSPFWRQEK